jgi:hypothetical protein
MFHVFVSPRNKFLAIWCLADRQCPGHALMNLDCKMVSSFHDNLLFVSHIYARQIMHVARFDVIFANDGYFRPIPRPS